MAKITALSQTRPEFIDVEEQKETDNKNETEEAKERKIEEIQEEMRRSFENWIILTQPGPVRQKIGFQYQARKLFGQVSETLGMKRLFLCCDGTLQNAVGTMRPMSNVARLARSIYRIGGDAFDCGTLGGVPQLAYYSSGIGSNSIIGADGLFAAATGKGFTGTVLNAYCFISNNYNGSSLRDEIILVGYSRGAFAMRCLAQFISDVGLLRRIGLPLLGMFWKLWLTGKQLEWDTKRNHFASLFFLEAKIKILAEWDPVKSLVWPRFHGQKRLANMTKIVPKRVENAFVAISLHEKRWSYKPVLWGKQEKGQNVHQCAFLGSHSDIGGGNIDAGLSTISLFWMVAKIQEACGARFDRDVLTEFSTGHQTTRLLFKKEISLTTQALSKGNVNESCFLWQLPRFICLGLCFNGNRSRLLKSVAKQENGLQEEPGGDNGLVRCELRIHKTVKSIIIRKWSENKPPTSLRGFATPEDEQLKWVSNQGIWFEEAEMGSEERLLLQAWDKAALKVRSMWVTRNVVLSANAIMTRELQPREHNESYQMNNATQTQEHNEDYQMASVTLAFMKSEMWRAKICTMSRDDALIEHLRRDFRLDEEE
ncbi:hypothetical protein F4680DRAFT_441316 [Xylaria scruposa]|nr:hypothetical protein F4680DRAFT_441316 [Xylaria scruposa]